MKTQNENNAHKSPIARPKTSEVTLLEKININETRIPIPQSANAFHLKGAGWANFRMRILFMILV